MMFTPMRWTRTMVARSTSRKRERRGLVTVSVLTSLTLSFPRNLRNQYPTRTCAFKASNKKMRRANKANAVSTFGERNGGEQEALKLLRERWTLLQERMKKEDGTGDRKSACRFIQLVANITEATYIDFYEASLVQWIKASSPEKYEKLLNLWGDDTFTKLMKKVEKYEG